MASNESLYQLLAKIAERALDRSYTRNRPRRFQGKIHKKIELDFLLEIELLPASVGSV
jgi:hypothetical protein